MKIDLDLQIATDRAPLPDREQFRLWVTAALRGVGDAVLTVRLVGRAESRSLNQRYRGLDRPTNVLSFPADLPPEVAVPLLGDVVICAPLVAEEARLRGREPEDHWAHLTIHGVLHLLGYDHQTSGEAEEMEAYEVELLQSLGISDPYEKKTLD